MEKHLTFNEWIKIKESQSIFGGLTKGNDKFANKPMTVDPNAVAATAQPGDDPAKLAAAASKANIIGKKTGKGAVDAAKAMNFSDALKGKNG